jgi:hypothetical protein
VFGFESEQVTREEWIVGGLPRIAIIGPIVPRGRPDRVDAMWREMGSDGVAWFKFLVQQIEMAQLGPGTHWIRLYYAQIRKQMAACEVLLDNTTWGPVQERMETAGWPAEDDFYSVRLFLILRDKESAARTQPIFLEVG